MARGLVVGVKRGGRSSIEQVFCFASYLSTWRRKVPGTSSNYRVPRISKRISILIRKEIILSRVVPFRFHGVPTRKDWCCFLQSSFSREYCKNIPERFQDFSKTISTSLGPSFLGTRPTNSLIPFDCIHNPFHTFTNAFTTAFHAFLSHPTFSIERFLQYSHKKPEERRGTRFLEGHRIAKRFSSVKKKECAREVGHCWGWWEMYTRRGILDSLRPLHARAIAVNDVGQTSWEDDTKASGQREENEKDEPLYACTKRIDRAHGNPRARDRD